jgi:hypothetical protein
MFGYQGLSIQQWFSIVDNLPYIRQYIYFEKSEIDDHLQGVCEYSYEKDGQDYNDDKSIEDLEYLDAKNWYNNLTDQDKKRVDVLTRSSYPVAFCGAHIGIDE